MPCHFYYYAVLYYAMLAQSTRTSPRTHYLLPTAHYLLLTTYYLLPTTYEQSREYSHLATALLSSVCCLGTCFLAIRLRTTKQARYTMQCTM